MRLAITVLALLAVLGAPAATSTGCKLCDAAKVEEEARGRDVVCPCCGERVKPENRGSQCESHCMCEHDYPLQAPVHKDDHAMEPASAASLFAQTHPTAASSVPTAGVNHTPAEVFTPLRV